MQTETAPRATAWNIAIASIPGGLGIESQRETGKAMWTTQRPMRIINQGRTGPAVMEDQGIEL